MLEVFTNWSVDNVVANIARIAFFVILFVLILFSLAIAGFPQQKFLRVLFSLIVSFLGIVFIKPDELIVIFQGYISLGMVFIAIIPFLILIPISVFLVSRGRKQFGRKLYLILWFLFVVFLGYQLFANYYLGWENLISFGIFQESAFLIQLVVCILSVLFLVFHRKFEYFIYKTQREIQQGKIRQGLLITKTISKMKRK